MVCIPKMLVKAFSHQDLGAYGTQPLNVRVKLRETKTAHCFKYSHGSMVPTVIHTPH